MTSARGGADRTEVFRTYWDEERETLAPTAREQIILGRLQHQLHYVYENLPFYRRLYDGHNFRPDQVTSLADFTERVPIVTKKMLVEDQREHPPFGSYLGVDRQDLVRIHGSSGTMGSPTMYGVSVDDWHRSAEVSAMGLWCAGIRPDSLVHITFPFSLFFGGWGVLQAVEHLGATVFPIGAMAATDQHVDFIFRLGCTVVVGTPSYLMHLGHRARELGRDLTSSSVELLMAGGEPGGSIPAVRRGLTDLWGAVSVVDASAGSTSEMYPFLSNIGCREAEGGVHLFQDENYTEIVERDNAHVAVPTGETGVPVATHLWRRSQPMIRFWTGDETVLDEEPCACGRTYPRLPRGVFGRVDDMIIVRGANIYPSAIEEVVRTVEGLGAEYRIVIERHDALDEICVEAEAAQNVGVDAFEQLAERLSTRLKMALQVRVPVTIVPPNTHEAQTFKARRVVDRRGET